MARGDSLEAVLDQLGVRVVSASPNEIACQCPFHLDKHPSFSMNLRQKVDREGNIIAPGVWICYQCGRSGSLSMLIHDLGGTDEEGASTSARSILREIKHRNVGKPVKEITEAEIAVDPYVLLAQYETFTRPPVWAVEERFFTRQHAAQFGIRWDHGWVIPIWGLEEEKAALWGWQYKQMKFVSNYPNAVKKSRTLFGLRELEGSRAVLVESPLDVARLAAAGVPAVASYGAFVSAAQIRLLVEAADEVVVALDNDEEGERQATKVYRELAKFVAVRKAALPDGVKDPGEMTDRQVRKVFS